MYEADDAIARVDSYIVSVNGAGKHVGERRLVRIDAVARSQATASLVDNGTPEASDGGQGDLELESSDAGGRRRGRRGGRDRSRAPEGAKSDG